MSGVCRIEARRFNQRWAQPVPGGVSNNSYRSGYWNPFRMDAWSFTQGAGGGQGWMLHMSGLAIRYLGRRSLRAAQKPPLFAIAGLLPAEAIVTVFVTPVHRSRWHLESQRACGFRVCIGSGPLGIHRKAVVPENNQDRNVVSTAMYQGLTDHSMI